MTSIPYPHPAELLAQAGWMRELAQSLLADPGAADDVVQETWIAALEHPPLADRPLEPWLARVVRNLAWKRRRGEARRGVHERAGYEREPVPGPEATLERLELQRTVLAAVEAIPEPFRTTVVERYLQGRSSADIARALALPEGTVRWRLKRGLEELRGHLDTRFGARDAWCALLGPLAHAPYTAGPAAGTGALARLPIESGVLTMIGASKLVLAAVVGVAAMGYFLWQSGDAERGEREGGALVSAATIEAPPPAPVIAGTPAERSEQRETSAAAPEASAPPRTVAPALAPASKAKDALLAMRFVDAQGAPWKDVTAAPLGAGKQREPGAEPAPQTSGPDGRVELRLGPNGADGEWVAEVLVHRTGCATRLLRAVATVGRTTDLGDVLLEPGARIEGRILDATGVALPGAEVGLATGDPLGAESDHESVDEGMVRRHGAEVFDRTSTVKSDASGAFALDGVAPGRWRLWAHAQGKRFGWTEPFDVPAGENVFGLEVRLPELLATDRITGIVLDPAGKPLPEANLISTYELEHESSSTTDNVDEDGRFDLVLRRDVSYSFVASDPEHRYGDAIAMDVAPGTRELELRLSEKLTFEVQVRDREGRALAACRFTLKVKVAGAVAEDRTAPEIVAPGLYRLARPARPFELEVLADGYLPGRFEELRPEAVSPRFDVVLDTAPRLRGRVFAEGQPVANARITLHRAVVEGSRFHNGFACLYEGGKSASVDEVTSDAEGRFELTCENTAPVYLRASSPGWVVGELGPLEPPVERELRVELTAGGAIEGRVLLPNGADGAGVVVGINHGDGHGRTMRAGPEGRFRFDHLAPGSWQVVRSDAELDPSSTTIMIDSERVDIEWSCTVEAGRTTHHDLDLTRP